MAGGLNIFNRAGTGGTYAYKNIKNGMHRFVDGGFCGGVSVSLWEHNYAL